MGIVLPPFRQRQSTVFHGRTANCPVPRALPLVSRRRPADCGARSEVERTWKQGDKNATKQLCGSWWSSVFVPRQLHTSGTLMATPASGFTSTSLAVGQLGEFDVMRKLVWDDPDPPIRRRSCGTPPRKRRGIPTYTCRANVDPRWHLRMAHPPRPQPDYCHGGDGDRLRRRRRPARRRSTRLG